MKKPCSSLLGRPAGHARSVPRHAYTPYRAPASFRAGAERSRRARRCVRRGMFVPGVVCEGSIRHDRSRRLGVPAQTVYRLRTRAVIERTPTSKGIYRFNGGRRLGAVLGTGALDGRTERTRHPVEAVPNGARRIAHLPSVNLAETYVKSSAAAGRTARRLGSAVPSGTLGVRSRRLRSRTPRRVALTPARGSRPRRVRPVRATQPDRGCARSCARPGPGPAHAAARIGG